MPVPDYADPRPAYMQIADDLRGQIEAGKYGPGDRLPSNRLMSEQYGVAAETLRQALDVLRGEGLIATQSTRGTFVLRKHRRAHLRTAAPQPSGWKNWSQRWLICARSSVSSRPRS